MLTSVSYSFNIVPINHAVHSIPVVYHLYGEWSSKGQVWTASSSVLSPSLPLRLQVGLKHLNTVQHRLQENTPIAVAVPCWVHLQSCSFKALLVFAFLWSFWHHRQHQLLHCGSFWTVRGTVFSHGSRMWSSNVDVCFLPVCRLRFM